ncbi:IS200/IS605 family transposase [Aquiflexum sp.]|uniref:IS200/IS605 family transposase n=1 Tax=Aquiflexum sp. TaxID=1872584 RepID=UPI0035947CF9
MSTYTQLLCHIIFSTYKRTPTLHEKGRPELFSYISGLLKNKNCHLYRINGMGDHIHIFTHVHPMINVSSLIKDIKLASSDMIKMNRLFDHFEGWQNGYGAFSINYASKNNLIEYIKNQQEHHKKVDFLDEYKSILEENGIDFDEKYLL